MKSNTVCPLKKDTRSEKDRKILEQKKLKKLPFQNKSLKVYTYFQELEQPYNTKKILKSR